MQKHEYKLIGTTEKCEFTLSNLCGNTVYYVIVTASNIAGEGYKSDEPNHIRTQPDSINNTSRLYVWGSNDNSELGLT